MSVKTVNKSGYVWGHIATIMFHVILSLILLFFSYKKNYKKMHLVGRYVGFVLGAVSLLALVPILITKEDDEIVIS